MVHKKKSYNFINLNSILDLFKKVDNKVENKKIQSIKSKNYISFWIICF